MPETPQQPDRMHTTYYLLLERPTTDFTVGILAFCAILGPTESYTGVTREFSNVGELREALDQAHVSSFELDKAIMSVRAGFTSYVRITLKQARTLRLVHADSKAPLAPGNPPGLG